MNNPIRLGCERAQELALLDRGAEPDPADRDLAGERVHRELAVPDHLAVAAAGHPRQHRAGEILESIDLVYLDAPFSSNATYNVVFSWELTSEAKTTMLST